MNMKSDPAVTQKQLDLMRHTCGISQTGRPYRNHFSADDGHSDINDLYALAGMGLMTVGLSSSSPDKVFCLTNRGYQMLGLSGTDAISS